MGKPYENDYMVGFPDLHMLVYNVYKRALYSHLHLRH